MSIPAIGAFKLEEVPASYDVVNKLIYPPGYDIRFSEQQDVKEHQLSFLAATLGCDLQDSHQQLEKFGASLKDQLNNAALQWKGVGSLELSNGMISFHAVPGANQLLQPVPAERVHGDRNQQTVLIGDKEVVTGQDEDLDTPVKRRSPLMIIAWILIIFSIAFIAFHFYKNGLKPSSSGNQMKIKIEKNN